MIMDNIIEPSGVYVRNLNINDLGQDVWSKPSSLYSMYTINYEKNLILGHYYYAGFTYKFTTTNENPTWVCQYLQSGYLSTSAKIKNDSGLTAGTIYTVTGIGIASSSDSTLSGTCIYNGNASAIKGVSSQAMNVFLFDVTDIYDLLQAYGLAKSRDELKTWCDKNIKYSPKYTNQALTITPQEKIVIKGGNIVGKEFVEPEGVQKHATITSKNPFFDDYSANSLIRVYNNTGNGNVTISKVTAESCDSPFKDKHPNCLKITTNGTVSPEAGGFYPSNSQTANSKVFIERFVAKIPEGYSIQEHYNPFGDGGTSKWLTSRNGTGDWEEYAIKWTCGATGTCYSVGHMALDGTDRTNVTWYLAYFAFCDMTDNPALETFSVLPKKSTIKKGAFSNYEFKNAGFNLLEYETSRLVLGTNWSYDENDVVGDGTVSIVQGANAASYILKDIVPIDPTAIYQISYYMKIPGTFKKFYTSLRYYITLEDAQNNKNGGLAHVNSNYHSDTKTTLAQDLNNGDTVVYLNSVTNWVAGKNEYVGFRSYKQAYNDKGCTSAITAIDTTAKTVTLSSAWTGGTLAKGTYAVNSFDSGTYPYPIAQFNVTTNGEWKKFTGTVGNGEIWDGVEGRWAGIPHCVKYMRVNLSLYGNMSGNYTDTTATPQPIKWCDIKIISQSPGISRQANNVIF